MAAVGNKEIPMEYAFMGEFFTLRRKYYIPEDTSEYWEQLILESNELAKKYNNDYFTQLLLVMLDDIERRAGNKSGDGYKALWNRLRGKKDGMEQVR